MYDKICSPIHSYLNTVGLILKNKQAHIQAKVYNNYLLVRLIGLNGSYFSVKKRRSVLIKINGYNSPLCLFTTLSIILTYLEENKHNKAILVNYQFSL